MYDELARMLRQVKTPAAASANMTKELAVNLSSALKRNAAAVVLAAVTACGGGGGGGGEGGAGSTAPLVYSGNTSAAIVSASNAAILVSAAMGGGQVVTALSAAAETGTTATGGLMDVGRRLTRTVRAVVAKPRTDGSSRVLIDESDLCPDGGTVRVFGDVTPAGTGTVSVVFTNCTVDGEVLSGQGSMVISSTVFTPGGPIPIDFTVSVPRLTIRGTANIDVGGTVRVQSDLSTNTDTITENMVALYILTGRMTKSENLVSVDVYDNILSPSNYVETIPAGRLFDSVHGYVDIVTTTPLFFASITQSFPSGGAIQFTGAGNRRVHALALSSGMLRVALDLNGDGVPESLATLGWVQLGGPIGADLADDDGDGMHNSWETANGLNPMLDEAAGDNDGDGFSALSEYLGGGSPSNFAVVPQLLSSVFPVASDIAAANSDTEVPGRSAIASDGANYLLVSCRQLGVGAGVFGAIISDSGQVLNTFLISSDACPQRPAVAFDGTNYLVVLSRGGQIVGIRVTPAGVVLDAAGFAISTPGSNFLPAVAFDGTAYLVVWGKFVSSQYEIYGARVTPSGTALGEFALFTAPGEQIAPALAFDGTNYLVVWRDTRTGSGPSSDTHIVGTRVQPDGTVLDPLGIPIAEASSAKEPGGIAFDGTNYLVVWNHYPTLGSSPPPDGKVFGRRVTPAGALLDGASATDGIPISTGPFANHSASVAFAGSTFVVAWAVGSFPNFPPAGIFATRVSKNGARIDGLATELGIPLSGPPPAFARLVHPVAASKGATALVGWVNNIELSGTQKDVLAALLFGL